MDSILNSIKENAQLAKEVDEFWKEYQAAQPSDVHLKYDLHDFADMYAAENDKSEEHMVDLLAYMYATGFITLEALNRYVDHLATKETTLNTRTHYTNK